MPLKHFEEISKIPRGSGNEKAVSDYVKDFATNLNCKVIQDKLNNLIIYKPASLGYEDKPPIILQAHLDMVNEKNAGTEHDFLTDPLKLYTDGDWLKAQGTTLGADNGIAVAYCMALLEDNALQHPPLEIVLTVEEESGMAGAQNIDATLLNGKRMINLDNSKDYQFIMGCAAGTTAEYVLPAQWEELPADADVYTITVNGLIGGHSGDDIEKERGNAIRILGQVLAAIKSDVKIAAISGGMKVNAIPREATATIVLPSGSDINHTFEKYKNDFAIKYRATDAGLNISLSKTTAGKCLSSETSRKLIASLVLLPNGVLAVSKEIDDLVNASCNLGVVETLEDSIKISLMPRGMSKFYNEHTETQIANLAVLTGANATFIGRSPAWPYNPNSELLKTAVACYPPIFGQPAKVTAIHAGLECGLFAEKISDLDIISFGPTIHDLHTPDERLSISSTEKMWELLKSLLAAL